MWLDASNILCLLEIYCFEVGPPCDYKLTVPGRAKGGHERKHGRLVASPGGACEIFKLGNMWRRWVGGSMLKDGERGGEEIRNNTEEEEC